MKVSIITTCLNRVDSIREVVRSVMRQTCPDVEHIIVDGASTDGTVEAIKNCDSPRITTLISEKDNGVYQALNKGVRCATGDIIGWLHSDDVFYDDHVLSVIADTFERTDCDVVYGDGIFVNPFNRKWIIRDWVSGKFSKRKMFNGWLPLHTTVFVRREIFEQFGYYREDYKISADTDWMLRIMLRTDLKVTYLNRYFVIMRYGGLSTSLPYTLRKWREDLGCYANQGISPRRALLQKVSRKIPQFFTAPFVKFSFTYIRTHLILPMKFSLERMDAMF